MRQSLFAKPQITQTQKLTFTQEIGQRLDILQMPAQTLRTFLMEKSMENPFLDADLESMSFDLRAYERYGTALEFRPELQIEPPWRRKELRTDLRFQLMGLSIPRDVREALDYLIDSLDERGYLDEDSRACAPFPESTGEEALRLLKSLDPPGVAAADLCECLLLQLDASGRRTPTLETAVREGLVFIATGRFTALAKLLGCTLAEAREVTAVIRSLNPSPAAGFASSAQTRYISPDAEIRVEDGELHIVLLGSSLFRLGLNPEYCAMRAGVLDKPTRAYMTEKHDEAKRILRAVKDRNDSFLRILQYLAAHQREFFLTGTGMRPLSQKKVAEELELHASTVSRAVREKYILCRTGIVPVQDLFQSDGVILERLRAIISSENPSHPLSDGQLAGCLADDGFPISRRSTAKYREKLGIPKAADRRREDALDSSMDSSQ